MIRDGLGRCAEAGYDAVVVLGDPAFYSAFGFVTAGDQGLRSEYAVGDHFIITELKTGALRGVRGTVKYQPEFREAEL